MKFDDMLVKYLGEFGPYQKLQFFLVCLPSIFTAMHSLSWTFTGVNIPHRCKLRNEPVVRNSTAEGDGFYLSPIYKKWLLKEKNEMQASCRRLKGLTVDGITAELNFSSGPESFEPCADGYIWNHTEITSTAVERWTLVCDHAWMRAFIQSMYYVGQFAGSFVFGTLADRYGRKNAFFAAILLQTVCGSLMAYAPWWPLFALFRIGVGFSHPGIFLIAVVIGMELVGPSKRVMAGVITGLFFALGQVILGLMAYFIKDYQHLQLAISLPALFFIFYWWIVPESARWLIMQKRYAEADVILQRAARFNGVKLPSDWHQMLDTETNLTSALKERTKYSYLDLFKTPRIRQRIIVTSFICWPAVSAAYYGLTMNPNFLGGDRYFSFMAMGFLEIPVLIILMFVMNVLGRKLLTMGGFLAAAISLLCTLLVPADYNVLNVVIIAFAKISLCAVYALLYVFTPELFPTVIRSTAMGSCSMVARVGAVSASYIAMWLVEYSTVAVVIIFGSICLIAGASIFLLPETTGQKQFDTIRDAEKFGEKRPLFSFAWKRESTQNEEGVELKNVNAPEET